MRITVIKSRDIIRVARFMRQIISQTFYYSKSARAGELEKLRPSVLQKMLKDKNDLILVAWENHGIVGILSGYYDAGLFWADWLTVDPRQRRLGVAAGLMAFLERRLRKEGVHKIWCDCRTNNGESKALLVKSGFKKIATVRNHWYGQDYILWQKRVR